MTAVQFAFLMESIKNRSKINQEIIDKQNEKSEFAETVERLKALEKETFG